eukprot:scaffold46896_cov13-Tisochrysis_lutea.AAC.1
MLLWGAQAYEASLASWFGYAWACASKCEVTLFTLEALGRGNPPPRMMLSCCSTVASALLNSSCEPAIHQRKQMGQGIGPSDLLAICLRKFNSHRATPNNNS